jgi:hypothetical protein
MYRIHIVGCSPRSGTTLLAEMMTACFEIDLHVEHEAHVYAWPPARGDVFLTKHPGDIVAVEPALRLMPRLFVVVMVRDPRDIVCSRHRSDPDRYWCGLKYWKSYVPWIRRLRGHSRVTLVRYEDLVSDPDRVQEDLARAMPWLVRRAPFREFHSHAEASAGSRAALGGVRPVSRDSIGNWRSHKPRVAGQIRRHGSISADLIEFGYEEDEAWERELEGVEPDLEPSHWPEHDTGTIEGRRRKAKMRAVWAVLGQLAAARALHRGAVRTERAIKRALRRTGADRRF